MATAQSCGNSAGCRGNFARNDETQNLGAKLIVVPFRDASLTFCRQGLPSTDAAALLRVLRSKTHFASHGSLMSAGSRCGVSGRREPPVKCSFAPSSRRIGVDRTTLDSATSSNRAFYWSMWPDFDKKRGLTDGAEPRSHALECTPLAGFPPPIASSPA